MYVRSHSLEYRTWLASETLYFWIQCKTNVVWNSSFNEPDNRCVADVVLLQEYHSPARRTREAEKAAGKVFTRFSKSLIPSSQRIDTLGSWQRDNGFWKNSVRRERTLGLEIWVSFPRGQFYRGKYTDERASWAGSTRGKRLSGEQVETVRVNWMKNSWWHLKMKDSASFAPKAFHQLVTSSGRFGYIK